MAEQDEEIIPLGMDMHGELFVALKSRIGVKLDVDE